MSNPTSNFGWQMPTPTDLVTDLPADFEVFGQAVDTSLADLKGGTTGQILSKATNTDMDFVWITNDQGDITAVNVTSPITGGGTSGAVTVGIQSASTSQSGAVQLSDSTSTTSSTLAATSTAVKAAYDKASTAASTSVAGIVQLSDSTSTTSSVLASTPTATKSAYDLASSAYAPAFTNNFYAGKNKVINGAFNVNQRNFVSTTTSSQYMFDRWTEYLSDGTVTFSAQLFTAGTAPVSGYESKNFIRSVVTGQTAAGAASLLIQNIEDVRTLSGQTATVSFWAKAASGTPKVGIETFQAFGSGGSPSAAVSTPAGSVTISTSWARYSVTFSIPSLSGKTVGTNNDSSIALNLWLSAGSSFATRASSIGIQNNTIDIWGVQIEAGSVATPFQTASGSIGGELALCQRYYYRATATNGAYGTLSGVGIAQSTTVAQIPLSLPVPLRTSPTSIDYSTIRILDGTNGYAVTAVANTFGGDNQFAPNLSFTVASGLTQWRGYYVSANNSSSGYIGLSAEL